MSLSTDDAVVTRMRSEDRRALVLEAATRVFGDRGYYGATTDQIAREAGVSQPYVVRMFGNKETLFLEVLQRALDRMMSAFRTALEENRETADPGDHEALQRCIGRTYVDLLADRGLLLSLMHAFAMGADPVIGRAARQGMLDVYRFLRDEVGLDAAECSDFLAGGMLLNTVVGMRMADDYDDDPLARELLEAILPTKLDLLLALRDEPTS
ncbi:TetR/AcrR family transcriptional regulator [Protaetiibacter intestinalis]|uniref:TetR/AcrR family transcriptional regulator n=1 Tax=Protaetiibacter intestinalis TaxID=2419774 RepID=UPI00130056C8|nr:TetR/AcrR family transcriptional regulator [Protaetiibacter intestinalis]